MKKSDFRAVGILSRPNYVVLGLMLCAFLSPAENTDEAWSKDGVSVRISGQFEHGQPADEVPIEGADKVLEPAFQNDIFGPQFTLEISHLAAGKYTVRVGEAETYFKDPDQRRFDVRCAGALIATNFDIFATAGGFGKV